MFWIAFAVLVGIRVPSLAQPAGGDQGLYWYVGERILHGELPYRDAWDQKPPGIHFTYALMMALWPHESSVPAADLVVGASVALLLLVLGRQVRKGAGETAALVFLALGNPVVTRLGGVRVRAQCETFIALAITVAMVVLMRRDEETSAARRLSRPSRWFACGIAIGVAAVFKYNAIVYLIVPAAVWLLDRWTAGTHTLERSRPPVAWRQLAALAGGCALPIATTLAFFAIRGAWSDLIDATITYNVQYSGETYTGPAAFVRYLLTFPYVHARIDSLWFVGGLGCAVLCLTAFTDPRRLIAPVWVALACLSIAINGSRDLQQYFLQAAPALALAAGVAAVVVWASLRTIGRVVAVALIAVAIWRITDIPKGVAYTHYDWQGLTGRLPRDEYLSRFGAEASGDKYSAAAVEHLAAYLKSHTADGDRVFVFGFSGAAYAKANRASASRFFWSRPVIVEFNRGRPGYGPEGLLAELSSRQPSAVVLQWRDWDPDTIDSATYFHRTAVLDEWLQKNYELRDRLGNYEIWLQASRASAR
jgi:hypothetical protein